MGGSKKEARNQEKKNEGRTKDERPTAKVGVGGSTKKRQSQKEVGGGAVGKEGGFGH